MSPPARLTHFSPVFTVRDLRRALAHYQSLGFATKAYADGDEYGFADRDGIGLHLAADPGHDPGTGASETYLYVQDADALYTEWSRPEIGGVTRPVRNTDYRLREGSHVDPDGNLIRFGSPLAGRSDVARLQSHLESRYGIQVAQVSELDAGVFRVDRRDGPSWVARRFPPARPAAAAAGDGEILRFLAEHDFPAERCAAPEPVSVLDGQGLLVTEYVGAVPREDRRAAIRDLGGLRRLGELLGRLHALPEEAGAVGRDGGAWHHLADGGPRDEVAAAARLLADAGGLVPAGERRRYESMSAALEAIDSCHGLPQALIHPDFVLPNVIASPDRGLVVVDWTGAGRGARLWSLAFLLFAEGAKNLRRVDLVVAGYRDHVNLEPQELSRLAAVARARPVIFESWAFCMGRKTIADAAREMAAAGELADAIGARARAAFAAKRTP
jgi:Ser/Thr protein kinase RdoA (MazF antagonist)